MRFAIALLVTVALGTGTVGPLTPTTPASAAAASVIDQQPEAQPQQPSAAPESQQDDAEITSAGWANILWIVVVLVLGVAFVWLAMAGLRTRTRE
jgi:hypothetical protein